MTILNPTVSRPAADKRRAIGTALTVLLAAMAFSLPVVAQSNITRLVVAFPPGGPVDFVARTMAETLGKELGHQVIVENKAGGNGAIAAEFTSASRGLGFMIQQGNNLYDTALVFVGVLTVIALALMLYISIGWLGHKLIKI